MAGDVVDDARDRFQTFLEPIPSDLDGGTRVDVDPREMADVVKAHLRRRFRDAPDATHLAVYGDGRLIGTTTRALILGPERMAADIGDGDGAAFPVASNDYRALLFRCPRRTCTAWAYASFFDERTNPVCSDHDGVPMRLVQAGAATGAF